MEKWRPSLGRHSLINASCVIRTALPLRHSTRDLMTSPRFHVASAPTRRTTPPHHPTLATHRRHLHRPGLPRHIGMNTTADHNQVVGAGPAGQTSHSRVEAPTANLRTPRARPDLRAHYIMGMYWRTAMKAEQCWPGGISGLRPCCGSPGAGRGKPTRGAPYDAPRLSPLGRPGETRAILNGIDADGIASPLRCAKSFRAKDDSSRRSP
jgi:hypothetical protein